MTRLEARNIYRTQKDISIMKKKKNKKKITKK